MYDRGFKLESYGFRILRTAVCAGYNQKPEHGSGFRVYRA